MAEDRDRRSSIEGKKKRARKKTAQASAAVAVDFGRMDTLRAHVIIHGLVQGVWFRASTKEQADRIGVRGWVKNLPDGSVEAVFEGEKKKVEEIAGWCHKGPLGARVHKVDISWGPSQNEFTRFEIRYGY